MPDQTQDWYDRHAESYSEQTWTIDLTAQRQRFLALLPPQGTILDMGCGSGRDAWAFRQQGYHVDARDGSTEMARLASARLGTPVRHQDLRALADDQRFDGIWLCAVLVHIPPHEIDAVLRRVACALKPGGVVQISVKEGDGSWNDAGRTFYGWSLATLGDGLTGTGLLRVTADWAEVDHSRDLRWLHLQAHRTSA